MQLSNQARELLDGKNFACVATIMPDGSPQVAPVWVERDGDTVVLNATESRQRTRNLKRDPRVALAVFDMANPYKKVLIRGRAVEITREGAEDHIDRLSVKYNGREYPDHSLDDPRTIIRIVPERVTH
ncbi:MAG: PPOX class F420-dependent oxidoreductase [Nitrososphaerota archaeon]|jgi:PPOX class probable F420-dependent enzyme|nr:PPOX class F420-dependent oxidoreductase [Nitrososphaerota archaeon]MDG6938664.1 PPOX class F420-dependent oxidoreductase [Nitrososphaerota archaeon]MDG6956215.1 PPOX class F420-dependent oxidoreductase [Nitrososphaerota archaeon]MDG6959919.1 PPOX class F420-dependent oxidoreductase [Nitrososphaerota archaeon]MDG6969231.1 PPOX class F420-dependent oxidoreductase [Nitrososphaerota archaeon]